MRNKVQKATFRHHYDKLIQGSNWSLLVAKGAQMDQTPALPTKEISNKGWFSYCWFAHSTLS